MKGGRGCRDLNRGGAAAVTSSGEAIEKLMWPAVTSMATEPTSESGLHSPGHFLGAHVGSEGRGATGRTVGHRLVSKTAGCM